MESLLGRPIRLKLRLVARKISSDRSDAVRVSDSQRQSVTADLSSDGQARYKITGRSRQNEDGVFERLLDDIVLATFDETVVEVESPEHAGIKPDGDLILFRWNELFSDYRHCGCSRRLQL
jgi:hypothetical protein